MMNNKMITTSDNPYNPHDDYEAWMQWDQANGYYTAEYIARLMDVDYDYDNDDNAMNNIYEEIIKNNITGNYILV